MMHFLAWVESLAFSRWVVESGSFFAYPTILFLHTAGLAFLVGPSVAIGLRIWGVGVQLPLKVMARLYPVMWAGFWVNAASGIALLMADATTKMRNWDFYVKLAFIFAAVWLQQKIKGRIVRDEMPVPRRMAVLWLVCWAAAITAGRLMSYLGPVSGAPEIDNHL